MGEIRRQTILSSIVIYIGFAIGFINTYFYVKNGTFTPEQYGLTRLFNDIGITFYSFATLGVLSYIYKFQPFYRQNLSRKENDQAALSLLVICFGFLLVVLGSILFKPLFIQKFSEKSRLFLTTTIGYCHLHLVFCSLQFLKHSPGLNRKASLPIF